MFKLHCSIVLAMAGLVAALALPARAQDYSMEYMAGFASMAQQICKFDYHAQAQRDIQNIRREAAGNNWRLQQLAAGEAAAKALGRDCKTMGHTVANFSW